MTSMAGEADIVIVGGGPAGLSAALLLGRCCRSVLLFDANLPRNRASKAVHGFFSRDGISPAELRRIGFRQLRPYRSVSSLHGRIVSARRAGGGFEVEHENGKTYRSRKLLLATGVKDVLPEVPGLERFYGRSAFHCPVCDGWEQRDQPLAVCGSGGTACEYTLELFCWSRSLTLCTNGASSGLKRLQRKRMEELGIRVIDSRMARLAGRGRQLRAIHFKDGSKIACHALFFCTEEKPASDLAVQLGAATSSRGRVKNNRREETGVPGLFVAGNTSPGVQLAVVAAAEGAKAAYAIHEELNQENLKRFGCG